jgi:aryl-alcohol dehydrogenase-like predicted oxidoreductase
MNFGGPTDEATSLLMIDKALDCGINFLDCANVYAEGRSEKILGKALKRNGKRHEVLVTSKAFLPTSERPNDRGNNRHNLINSCIKSLKRLQTDYIDIFFLHRTDWNTPQEETLSALNYMVDRGYIRYIACSTHPAWRTVEALHIADRKGYPKFVCEQPPYNLLDRRIENEIVPMCQEYDLGIITWSPLAQGVLAGRYRTADDLPINSRATQKSIYAERITDAGIKIARRVRDRAKEKDLSPTALSCHGSYTNLPSPRSSSDHAALNIWMTWSPPRISTCHLKTWPGSTPSCRLAPSFPIISTAPDGNDLHRLHR